MAAGVARGGGGLLQEKAQAMGRGAAEDTTSDILGNRTAVLQVSGGLHMFASQVSGGLHMFASIAAT